MPPRIHISVFRALSIAVLSMGIVEVFLFGVTQFVRDDVPAWASTPLWVVFLRSAVPALLCESARIYRIHRHKLRLRLAKRNKEQTGNNFSTAV